MQLQQLVVSGELPCSKEEAATLAGIQLHLEDTWPDDIDNDQTPHDEVHGHENDRLLKNDQNRRPNVTKKFSSSRRRGKLTPKSLICLGQEGEETGRGYAFLWDLRCSEKIFGTVISLRNG